MAGCCEHGNEPSGFINCGVPFFFSSETSPLRSVINRMCVIVQSNTPQKVVLGCIIIHRVTIKEIDTFNVM